MILDYFFSMSVERQLILSMIANIVLLFSLFQPNIVKILHSSKFDWKDKRKEVKFITSFHKPKL